MLEFRLQKYLVNFRRVLKRDRGIKFRAGICASVCASTARHYSLFSSSAAFIFFSADWRKSFQTPLAPSQPLLTMQPARKSICPRLQRKRAREGGRGRVREGQTGKENILWHVFSASKKRAIWSITFVGFPVSLV